MKINEQGRSMIEMLGVLAIVGVLSVGGIAGYSKAMNKFKTNKVIDQINMISTNIRTLYSSQRNYNGLDNLIAVKTGVVPAEMYDASKVASATAATMTLTHAFGGQLLIKTAATSGDGEGAYVLAIDGVPSSACISIATTDWGGDSGSGLMGMYINAAASQKKENAFSALSAAALTAGATNHIAVPGDSSYGLPFTLVNANTECNPANGGDAAIAWKFM